MTDKQHPYFDVKQLGYINHEGKAFIGFKLYDGVSDCADDTVFMGLTAELCKDLIDVLEDHMSRNPG